MHTCLWKRRANVLLLFCLYFVFFSRLYSSVRACTLCRHNTQYAQLALLQCLYSPSSSEMCDQYLWRKPRCVSNQRKTNPTVTTAIPHVATASRIWNEAVGSQCSTSWSDCQDIFLLLPSFSKPCLQMFAAFKGKTKKELHILQHLQELSLTCCVSLITFLKSIRFRSYLLVFGIGVNLMCSDKIMAFLLNCMKCLLIFVMKIRWTVSENGLAKWKQCPTRAR